MNILGPDRREKYIKVEIVEGYDKWASTYDYDSNPLIALEEKFTSRLFGDVQGCRVLDLGCGTGRYCVLLAQRGANVIGIDASPEMLERARQKISSDCSFEIRLGTLEDLNFADGYFDLVVSALTLCHISNLEPTLKEAVRVLRQGGRMIISDIHPYWPISGHDYTEFFDANGQEYRIPLYTHTIEEYWHLFKKFNLVLEDIYEPRIDSQLIELFPSLKEYMNIPLAIILKLQKTH